MRHRLATVVLLSVVTSAACLVALVHALSVTTAQRVERTRESVDAEVKYLASQPDLRDALAAPPPDISPVGLSGGVIDLGQVPPRLPGEWATLLLKAQSTPGPVLEQELQDGTLLVATRPLSNGRLAWAGALLRPSTYRRFWQLIVIVLSIATALLVSVALSSVLAFRRSAATLRACLSSLAHDLSTPIPRPPVGELAEVTDGIAKLAHDLAESREKEELLSHELSQKERLAALGRVVAGVAHEVRNPLASIKLHLDLAAATASLPTDVKGAVTHASEEIARLDRLVADFLVVAGRRLGPRVNMPLGELVRRRLNALGPWVAEHQVSVQTQGDGEALVDPDALGRALDNLLRNAVEASPAGSTVEVRVVDEREVLRLRVEDHGVGISPEHDAEIFEPFFTTKPEGTGLGLAISRAIARAHGGELSYRRHDGTTTFELSLGRGAGRAA